MQNPLDLLEKIVRAYGVAMRRYGESLTGLEEYDNGLRSLLFSRHDTRRLAEFLRATEFGVLYIMDDPYDCRYCFFRTPPPPRVGGADIWYCIIGPWRERSMDDTGIDRLLRRCGIPDSFRQELSAYMERTPYIASPHSWETALLTIVGYLYDAPDAIRLSYCGLDQDGVAEAYSPDPQETLSLRTIEERYENENAMLAAISAGDAKTALRCIGQFGGYRMKPRSSDKLRDSKNYLIVLNSLSRKAAENGYVHPAHLDAVSADFARRIESARTLADLSRMGEIMLRRYCDLVDQFSLREYSPSIRNAINTIDFHLNEELSLALIAKRCYVNPSYLSMRFKKEKKMTLTGYITAKRLQRAASLLGASGAYIQDVAEQCGFLDINYFSRLFKRQFGLSPSEFRKRNHRGEP
jgi:AraC-like DNA-binding protein